MTKEITKSIILQQMQDKFGLREFEPSPFLFSETVHPVYSIEREIETTIAQYKEVSVTSATYYNFFAVPRHERWWLQRYVVVFMGAGAYTVTGVYLVRKHDLTPTSSIYLDMTAGQTVSYMNDLPKPVRLDTGDVLSILVDSFTSTQDLRLYIDCVVEEIR